MGAFQSGFKLGMDAYQRALDNQELEERRAQRQALKQIAEAKPDQLQGFTANQGEELQRAAASGMYDIKFDDAKQGYTVTAKGDPAAHTGVIAQQGVTDFLGQRTVGAMTPDQEQRARLQAMTGVVAKTDPIRGVQLAADIRRGEREDQRFEWERDRAEREQRQAAQSEVDEKTIRGIDDDVGAWMKQLLARPDGTMRAPTVDDYLAAGQRRAGLLTQAGKVDAAGAVMKDISAQSLVKIQLETKEREQALGQVASALAAGDTAPLKEFYNRFIPDGGRVTNVTKNRDGSLLIERETLDGRPLAPTKMKDTGQALAALNTFRDPMALYNWSQNEFRNNMALRADARAERADARAATAASEQSAERKRKVDQESAVGESRAEVYRESNPSATPAQVRAAQLGVIPVVREQDPVASSKDISEAFATRRWDPVAGKSIEETAPGREAQFLSWSRAHGVRPTKEALLQFRAIAAEAPPNVKVFSDKDSLAAAIKSGAVKVGETVWTPAGSLTVGKRQQGQAPEAGGAAAAPATQSGATSPPAQQPRPPFRPQQSGVQLTDEARRRIEQQRPMGRGPTAY